MPNRILEKFTFILFIGSALAILSSAVIFWTVTFSARTGLLLPDGNPVGGDFLAFYNSGLLFGQHPNRLYDLDAQWQNQKELFTKYPSIAESPLPFVYPPLVALPFKYLSKLPFVDAFLVQAVFGGAIYLLSLILLTKSTIQRPGQRFIFILIGLGFSPFITHSLISGHLSFIGIFALSAYFLLAKQRKDFRSGVVLSLSYYKPPLFLVFVLLLFLQKQWKKILGFLFGAIILTSLSFLLVGYEGMLSFLTQISRYHYGSEVNPGRVFYPKQGAGLLAAITSFSASKFEIGRYIFVVVSLGILFFFRPWLERVPESTSKEHDLQFSLMVILSTFLSLQMVDYDVSYLVIPIILIGHYLVESRNEPFRILSGILLAIVYVGWSFTVYLTYPSDVLFSVLLFSMLLGLSFVCLWARTRVGQELLVE